MEIRRKSSDYSAAKNAPVAEKTNIEIVFILLLLLLAFISCLDMSIFQIYFYQGVGYLLNVAVIALCFGIYLLRNRKFSLRDFKVITFSLILILYCVSSAIATNGGLRYAGTVFNTVVLVIVLRDSKISFRAIKNTCFAIFAIMIIVALNSSGYYQNQFVNDSVNSNYIAQLASAGMIYVNYLLSFMANTKKYRISLLRIAVDLLAVFIMWECQSRGSMIAIVFFVGMYYLFPKRLFQRRNFATYMSVLITSFGVLMTYIYLKYFVPLNIVIMGKSSLTRNRLWTYFWENIGRNNLNFFIGYGTNDSMRDIFGYGFHNIYLGIWYDIGLIGLLLFMGFIFWNIKEIYKSNKKISMLTILGLIGFMTFQISDYFAVTFTGPLVIWNYVFLGLVSMVQKYSGSE